MAVANEGTTSLPSDAAGRYALGLIDGVNWYGERAINVYKPIAAASDTVEKTIWTPAAGKKFRVRRMVFTVNAAGACTITIRDNTAGTTIMSLDFATGVSVVVTIDFGELGYLSAAANNVLTVQASTSAAAVKGVAMGNEE